MLFARLLAFLGMLFLAQVAQASPGDTAYGPGLCDVEALLEGSPRPAALADPESGGADALPAQARPDPRQVTRTACQPLPKPLSAQARHRRAQPRAPPFPKA